MKRIIFPIFFLLINTASYSQIDSSQTLKFKFLPAGLIFNPLYANNIEARMGILYYTATSNLKVDIGNNVDLFKFSWPDSKINLSLGIEFMAYAYSTSYAGYRLQIDALDGFFGGHLSFSKKFETNKLLARFRIIHNSAHFVDGHYNTSTGMWLDGRGPIPYTEDFGELTVEHEIPEDNFLIQYYGGVSYSTLVRPLELKKYKTQLGAQISVKDLLGKVFDHDENIFIAHHFLLSGNPVYEGSNQTVLGIKFGSWFEKGVVFYLSYYNGRDVFSSYYNMRVSWFGIGFNVDFF